MKYLFPAVLITFIGAFIYAILNLGLHKSVTISSQRIGPLYLAYKEYVGPYHQINDTLKDVENWAKTQGLDCRSSFGEFLDNPEIVDHDRLRANVGCVFTESVKKYLSGSIKELKLDESDYYVANFAGSPWVGPLKVYPKIMQTLESNSEKFDGHIFEIYEHTGFNRMQTKYLVPKKLNLAL